MTEILRPEVIWIEGRCYRVNDPVTETNALQEHDLYENEVPYSNLDDDDEEEFEVVQVDDSRYTSNVHVSKHYIGSIIGKRGAMKSRIEHDTRTEIKIPRQGQTGDITIFGPSVANVNAARRRINIIVMSSRMKQKSTHFLSIPMNNPDIMNNFEKFKAAVLKECASSRGLEESLFIKPSKLHITLGMMCLMDNEERLVASKLLTEAKDTIIMPLVRDYTPLRLRLRGLSYMNDDPAQIDVLYGRVQEDQSDGVLQSLADALFDYFSKAGYMQSDHGREHVKLHVTLINSKYRSRSSLSVSVEVNEVRGDRRVRETFDGSDVLRKFSDYDFGVIEFKEIQLSQRHSMGSDGYYQSTSVVLC